LTYETTLNVKSIINDLLATTELETVDVKAKKIVSGKRQSAAKLL